MDKYERKIKVFENTDRYTVLNLFLRDHDDGDKVFRLQKHFHFLTTCFLELVFITDCKFKTKNEKEDEIDFLKDHKLWTFFLSHKKVFPLMNSSCKPCIMNQKQFIDSFRNVMSHFNEKNGGRNRRIMLHLLFRDGVSAKQLADLCGCTESTVYKANKSTTKEEEEEFYKRFHLTKQKEMYSKEELSVVLKSFEMSCPSNSYSKKKDFRQICGNDELYMDYKKYIMNHNLEMSFKPDYKAIETRCYNVFLDWKKKYNVRKTTQADIDYNCKYCFEHWKISRDVLDLNRIIRTKENILGMLKNQNDSQYDNDIVDLNSEIEKIKKKLDKKKERLKELQKHKDLMNIQRKRVEEIDKKLKRNELLVFFDYTKYNYLCHDLDFVIVYRDSDNNLQRKYLHYMHSKMKNGRKIPNDGYFSITGFQLFKKRLVELGWSDRILFLASDGGPHFICATFVDHLSRMTIEEWNRFAAHHGGNYADREFGICKCSLRAYEQKHGQRKSVEEILVVLRNAVKERDAEFYLIDDINTDLDFVYKSNPFPNGIKSWHWLRFNGCSHKIEYGETHKHEKSFQIIKGESKYYEEMEDEESTERENEDENDEGEIHGDVEEEEGDQRNCTGCGLIIEEDIGYIRCSYGACDHIYHSKVPDSEGIRSSCHDTMYDPTYDTRFVCKQCKRM